ncbi:MAG: TonB-dependent receptor [Saprospiraceae bacterium]|nr:TonB-dependent receptor [Saprospiraceae bacterium]
MIKYLVIITTLIFEGINSNAQQNDSLIFGTFEEILLSDIRPVNGLPWTYTKDTLHVGDRYQNNVRNLFDRKAGIQSLNGENFAQDVRIAIRGFGSRTAFGIRGIRIYQDGIPLTSPDGTTQLDELSIFDIQTMDVVRSGLSARLGNAGGGAIAMKSTNFNKGITINTKVNSLGSFDLGLKYGASKGRWDNLLSVNHHTFKSKRKYAEAQNNTLYNKTRFSVNDRWQLDMINSLYISPVGNDPGAHSLLEYISDKYKANARNLLFKAGESVSGFLTAVKSMYAPNEKSTWLTNVFYRKRIFTGRLPFTAGGWVDLNRDFVGINNMYEFRVIKNSIISLGQSAEYQDDRRRLAENINGVKGESTADQNESVFNLAFYQQWQMNLSDFSFHQLLRYDYNRFALNDHFNDDGIQNGQKTYQSLNAAVGLGYHLNKTTQLYSNVSTSFEMPTLNELTNNPESTGGFNASLNPERSVQAELGIKYLSSEVWQLTGAFFIIALKDQIQGYELAATPGRTYYRNAAKSKRHGMELTTNWKLSKSTQFEVNYTYSDFTYSSFVVNNNDYSGNHQTLVPGHKANLTVLNTIKNWLDIVWSISYCGKMFLDDANLNSSESFEEVNIVISSGTGFSKTILIGSQVNNLFNLMTYSNFRTNAVGQRYFEAASPAYIGIFLKADLF